MRIAHFFVLCLSGAFVTVAQDPSSLAFDPVVAAEEEALRRAETAMVMDLNLSKAEKLQDAKDYAGAASLYEEAIGLAQQLGNLKAVEDQLETARKGVVYSRLQMAYDFQNANKFTEAEAEVAKALKYDPENKRIRKFREFNREVELAHKGRVPSVALMNELSQAREKHADILTLIRDGKAYFELRQFDKAEDTLKEAIKLDPQNDIAYYYLRLILEARYDIEVRQREHTYSERVIEVAEAWNKSQHTELPTPNAYYLTNSQIPFLTHTSKGAQHIRRKLHEITISEIAYDGLTLDEVVLDLIEQVKRNDPDKQGLNFLINSQVQDQVLQGGAAGGAGLGLDAGLDAGLDPAAPLLDAMGNPIAAPPPIAPGAGAAGPDLTQVLINIKLPLFNLKLEHVLDAIVKTADQPIKYIIEEYAIVFTPKLEEQRPLFTRIFKVNPDTFVQGLEGVTAFAPIIVTGGQGGAGGGAGGGGGQGGLGGAGGGGGGQGGQGSQFSIAGVSAAAGGQGGQGGGGQGGGQGGGGGLAGGQGGGGQQGQGGLRGITTLNDPTLVNQLVRAYFSAAGVGNLGVSAGPQATQVFFNDRNGLLLVRATLQDLDIIQQAIELLNVTPPQLLIESKFAEISQNDNKGFGFEWFLGNTSIQQGQFGFQGGTAPTYQDRDGSFANPSGLFPTSAGAIISPRVTDTDVTGTALRQSAPALFTLTGILTDPQFRTVIHAIESRDGSDILIAPRVVTTSGRQAQIQAVDVATIVTSVQAGGQAGGGGGNIGGNAGGGAVNVTFTPTTQPIPTGPVLNVLPTVNSDGYSINMALIPSIVEFAGYDDPGQFAVVAQSVAGNTVGVPIQVALPLPRTRIRQVVTTLTVWDQQTVMLGGLISERIANTRDKLPVLGDLPLFGKLFRSEHKTTRKSNLVIFVTPTIIDPAGNKVHTDDEMPFAKPGGASRRAGLQRRR